MKKLICALIVLTAIVVFSCDGGSREIGDDADNFGYQVTVKCSNGMTLHGWASTKSDIPSVKRELKQACSIYDK